MVRTFPPTSESIRHKPLEGAMPAEYIRCLPMCKPPITSRPQPLLLTSLTFLILIFQGLELVRDDHDFGEDLLKGQNLDP